MVAVLQEHLALQVAECGSCPLSGRAESKTRCTRHTMRIDCSNRGCQTEAAAFRSKLSRHWLQNNSLPSRLVNHRFDTVNGGRLQYWNTHLRFQQSGKTRWCQAVQVGARLLDPVVFDAAKLTVDFMDAVNPADVAYPQQLLPRCYTLTHHDVTAELQLSIGSCVNERQLSGWYTRLLRDEVVAEWRTNGHNPNCLSLHVHCHISGGQAFLAPASLRDWIFQREMPLVLQAFRHGDRALFEMHPKLDFATVWVHYHSVDPRFSRADCWGPLRLAVGHLDSSLDNGVSKNEQPRASRLHSLQDEADWIKDLNVMPDLELNEALFLGCDGEELVSLVEEIPSSTLLESESVH